LRAGRRVRGSAGRTKGVRWERSCRDFFCLDLGSLEDCIASIGLPLDIIRFGLGSCIFCVKCCLLALRNLLPICDNAPETHAVHYGFIISLGLYIVSQVES
jgi:hypothetical protein